MTFIHWTVSREASPNSLLKIRTRAARRLLLWTARVLAVFIAISMPAAHAAMLYAQPYRAGGYLLPLLWLLATGFALLAAALGVHAYEQRSSIARLAAAIEQRSSTGTLPQSLPEFGPSTVARLARAINGAQRCEAERVAELLDVLAAYAHDLRTPLTRMALRCERVDEGELRSAIERDIAEMNELVEASLACARMQCCAGAPLRRFDADGLLGALVDNYKDMGRSVELEGEVGHPVVTCPHALRRVLVNLIDNGLRYGNDVRLCVRVDARRVVVAIVDSGPGIVPAEMEAVFAPWYRAPQTAARAPGSGLGLAIARRLTLAMQGELQLENRHSGGLEARLTLPLAA
ncbi:histidine kinase [Paraburkholderia graminis]|uniref:ATP-binding protein n=1 Tax=Paraburkholderia graminis TaxID=60548 RepID=UPI000DEF9D6F|nr:ATP-binding protein [Paraburkholderia graminis]AXF11814.1 histidine kinase [Paraburkholderia graminis]MDR6471144.1 signal transduction histidine kinase [Paraburkholderia graminis]